MSQSQANTNWVDSPQLLCAILERADGLALGTNGELDTERTGQDCSATQTWRGRMSALYYGLCGVAGPEVGLLDAGTDLKERQSHGVQAELFHC